MLPLIVVAETTPTSPEARTLPEWVPTMTSVPTGQCTVMRLDPPRPERSLEGRAAIFLARVEAVALDVDVFARLGDDLYLAGSRLHAQR